MARDYKNSQVKPSASKTNPFSFLIGLLLGLILAVGVYFYLNQNSEKESTAVIEEETEIVELEPVEKEVELLSKQKEITNEQVPIYDFYNMLPNMEVNVSEWVEEEQPSTKDHDDKPGIYVLQVGSFRKLQAADEVKARLALLGINADIQRVVINGQDIFHRVRIGPYKTAQKLEEAQSRLLDNDLNFKLLKLTIEDL